MIKDIDLDGKIVRIEFILPKEIRNFLQKNNVDKNQLLKDYKWEQYVHEDLNDWSEEEQCFIMQNDFEKAKLVINYIHFSQENQIRVSPEEFVNGNRLVSGNWGKGIFSNEFSIGYSIFTNNIS